jgi:hypothetical protein
LRPPVIARLLKREDIRAEEVNRTTREDTPPPSRSPNRFEFRSGLMPRSLKPSQKSRHDPLHRDIAADDIYEKYGNISKPGRRKKTQANEHDEDVSAEVTLSRPESPSTVLLTPTPFLRLY